MTKRATRSNVQRAAKRRRQEEDDSIVPDCTVCTQPLQLPQLPDEIQYRIVCKVINPGSKSTPFKTSDLVYAGVCKKWQTFARSLIEVVSLNKVIEDLVALAGNSAKT